jgi:thiamine transport system permease protein
MIPLAHTLIGLPFVVRSVLPSLQAIPRSTGEAASLLGATPAQRALHIDIPLVSRAILVGAAFAFTTSIGEFGAGLFLARPNAPTLSTAIYRFLGQPGITNYGQAYALSAVLLLVCLACFLLIERLRPSNTSEL